MRAWMGARRLALGVLGPGLAAVAAACSSSSPPPLLCPRTAIIDGLASFERYRPGLPEQEENLVYRAALENITGTCRSDGADVSVDVGVELLVEPGPAFLGPGVEVPYFVAVLDPTGEVLDRRDYVARVTPAPDARRSGSSEQFSQRFVGVGPSGAAGYRVLFGFALPEEEALRRAPGG